MPYDWSRAFELFAAEALLCVISWWWCVNQKVSSVSTIFFSFCPLETEIIYVHLVSLKFYLQAWLAALRGWVHKKLFGWY